MATDPLRRARDVLLGALHRLQREDIPLTSVTVALLYLAVEAYLCGVRSPTAGGFNAAFRAAYRDLVAAKNAAAGVLRP